MAEIHLPKDDPYAPRYTLTSEQARMGIEILNDNTNFNRTPVDERQAAALERIAYSLELLVRR